MILEIFLALCAAFGLLSLLWLCLGRMLDTGGHGAPVFSVLVARGEAETLEHEVNRLQWQRNAGGRGFTVIADDGLSADGRQIAIRLAQREPGVVYCPLKELEAWMRSETRTESAGPSPT